jgi:hypothetical protein
MRATASFPKQASNGDARHPWPTLPLALTEGRRLALHPLTVVGLTVTVVVTVLSLQRGPGTTFDAVTAAPTFYFGVFVILASNLIATRDGRSGATEMLTATPTPTARRTLALIIASALPAGCCAVVVLLADAYLRATHRYVVAPSAWYLTQAPLTIFGAALLGILVARWLPYRAAPYLVVVSVAIGNVIASNHPETINTLGLYVAWERFVPSGGWAGLYPGSVVLHTGYLAGLSALAGICALAYDAPRRTRYLVAAAATLAATAVSAWTQLP